MRGGSSTLDFLNVDPSTFNAVRAGDSSNNAIRVAVVSGGGTGGTASSFGATFPANGTAAGFIDSSGNMAGGLLDSSGYLRVNVSAGSGGNGAASNTGAAVPTQASYTGWNSGGNLVGASMAAGFPVQPATSTIWAASQSGTWNITNVSGTISLPTGASTAAKQPALGTAGSASADVISVQGIASMTPLLVNGSGVTQPISGTVAATQSGTWTVQPGNTANSTAWLVTGTGGTFPVTNAGLTELAAAINGSNQMDVNIAASGVTVPVSIATNTPVGTVAHDAADSGAPLKVGAKAESSLAGITLVADGDRTDLYSDLDGVLIVKNAVSWGDLISERVSNTDGASTAFSTFGATASARNMITAITVHNAHATTNGYVDIRDGTGGAVLWTIPLPATGGAVLTFDPPLRQPTANTALAYDVSAAISTIYISVNGFKSKV